MGSRGLVIRLLPVVWDAKSYLKQIKKPVIHDNNFIWEDYIGVSSHITLNNELKGSLHILAPKIILPKEKKKRKLSLISMLSSTDLTFKGLNSEAILSLDDQQLFHSKVKLDDFDKVINSNIEAKFLSIKRILII